MFVHIYTQKLMTGSIYSINIWWCIGIRIINRMFSLPISKFSMINRLPLVSLEFQKTKPKLSSVQFNSVAQSCPTLWNPMNRSTPGLPVHHQLPEFTQTHAHRVGDTIQPSHPLLSPSPSAPNPSSIRVFSNESTLRMRWPEYWSFRFSISPSNEHPGLISFRVDWLDLLAVQGTLKSLLQHHSSKPSSYQKIYILGGSDNWKAR